MHPTNNPINIVSAVDASSILSDGPKRRIEKAGESPISCFPDVCLITQRESEPDFTALDGPESTWVASGHQARSARFDA